MSSWVFHWSLEHIVHTLMLKHPKSSHLTLHPSGPTHYLSHGKTQRSLPNKLLYPFSMAAAVSFQKHNRQVTAFALWKEAISAQAQREPRDAMALTSAHSAAALVPGRSKTSPRRGPLCPRCPPAGLLSPHIWQAWLCLSVGPGLNSSGAALSHFAS